MHYYLLQKRLKSNSFSGLKRIFGSAPSESHRSVPQENTAENTNNKLEINYQENTNNKLEINYL